MTENGERSTGYQTFPGQQLGLSQNYVPGEGAFEKKGKIYASLAGSVAILPSIDCEDKRGIITVKHFAKKDVQAQVPQVGDVVMGKVTRVSAQNATVEIQCLGEHTLSTSCQGVIRIEDVFPSEVDFQAVHMLNCFRPGDIVKARILSLGDSRQYFLSTSEVQLGVCWTKSSKGDIMLPVAWDSVESKDGEHTEQRKTALPASTTSKVDQSNKKRKHEAHGTEEPPST